MIDQPATTDPAPTDTPAEHGRSVRNAAFLTAGVGIAFSVLFFVSLFLISLVPSGNATEEEIRAFYRGSSSSIAVVVGLYVMPFSGIAFIWFIVAMRMWAALSVHRQSVLYSNLQLVSGIGFVVITFVAAAAIAVVAVTVQLGEGPVDTTTARQFPVFGTSLMLFFSMRMAAMFVFTTTALGRAAGYLPRWFAIAGYAVGLFLLLTATFSPLLVLLFPTWVLVLCVILLRTARRIPTDLLMPRPVLGTGNLGALRPDERPPLSITDDGRIPK
jgi:hypothetical protein